MEYRVNIPIHMYIGLEYTNLVEGLGGRSVVRTAIGGPLAFEDILKRVRSAISHQSPEISSSFITTLSA
jgi:hypothetical protein